MCDLKSLVGLKLLPGFRVFANPGRTAVLIRDSLLVDCTVEERKLDPGYIQSVEVTPTGPNSVFLASWTILNVYLQCGATAEARSKRTNQIEPVQIHASHRLPPGYGGLEHGSLRQRHILRLPRGLPP